MINILLVDDHQLFRAGVKSLLGAVSDMKVIGEADTGESGFTQARELQPHIVLMDLKMPGIGGLEASRKLLRYDPDIKIIVLTRCKEEPYPSRLLETGAMGYLTKECSVDELVNAIRAVHSGQRYITASIAQQLAFKNIRGSETSPFELLSERELQIMGMITSGQKIQEISDKLCLSSKTVNTYRYRIFAKLAVVNDVALTHLAARHGLLDEIT